MGPPSLRTSLVNTELAWEQRYGIAPAITSALSETTPRVQLPWGRSRADHSGK
jgi:hypothetical protein